MEQLEEPSVLACWHCGAPVHRVQKFCLTCGNVREREPQQAISGVKDAAMDQDSGLVDPSGQEPALEARPEEMHEKRERVMEIRHKTTGAVLFQTDSDTLEDAHLCGRDLRGADLSGIDLSGIDLSDADLRGADLRGADLTFANLISANLEGASLAGAVLKGANLRGANVLQADLNDADLTDAPYDAATRWPEGYEPGIAGAILVE
jgi:pentapeptide repeat protein